MNWITEWPRLSKRIEAFEQAARSFFHQSGAYVSNAYTGTIKLSFEPLAKRIASEVSALASDPTVPSAARDLVKSVSVSTDFGSSGWAGLQIASAQFSCLRLELNYYLADPHVVARRLIQRAFLHLQRSIVADPEIRSTWEDAFAAGEVELERLGGAHLLLHGIWAFKSHGPGERTDLVLGDRLAITSEIREAAEGMVLTEWKKVSTPSEFDSQASAALQQAKLYSQGIVAGFELAELRLLVLVSKQRHAPRADEVINGVTYRYVNVAVSPETPSQSTIW